MEFESNLRPRAWGRQEESYPQERAQPTVLRKAELEIEYKRFVLSLEENHRGRYLRISELAGGRRNSVVIPSTGLNEFEKVLLGLLADKAPSGPGAA